MRSAASSLSHRFTSCVYYSCVVASLSSASIQLPWSLFLFMRLLATFCFFFFNDTATTEIYTLSLHDALPISRVSEDADRVADAQGSRFQAYRGDGKMAVVVRHDADELFAGERFRTWGDDGRGFRSRARGCGPSLGGRARGGLWRGAFRRLFRCGLLERFGLLADRRFSGRGFLAFDFGFRVLFRGGHGALHRVCG